MSFRFTPFCSTFFATLSPLFRLGHVRLPVSIFDFVTSPCLPLSLPVGLVSCRTLPAWHLRPTSADPRRHSTHVSSTAVERRSCPESGLDSRLRFPMSSMVSSIHPAICIRDTEGQDRNHERAGDGGRQPATHSLIQLVCPLVCRVCVVFVSSRREHVCVGERKLVSLRQIDVVVYVCVCMCVFVFDACPMHDLRCRCVG